jgi:hypothetical protein
MLVLSQGPSSTSATQAQLAQRNHPHAGPGRRGPAATFNYGFEGISTHPILSLPAGAYYESNLPDGVANIQVFGGVLFGQVQIPFAGFSGFCAYGVGVTPGYNDSAAVLFTRGYRHARIAYAMLDRDNREYGYVKFWPKDEGDTPEMATIDIPYTVGANWVDFTAPAGTDIWAVGFVLPRHAVVDNIEMTD